MRRHAPCDPADTSQVMTHVQEMIKIRRRQKRLVRGSEEWCACIVLLLGMDAVLQRFYHAGAAEVYTFIDRMCDDPLTVPDASDSQKRTQP